MSLEYAGGRELVPLGPTGVGTGLGGLELTWFYFTDVYTLYSVRAP